MIKQSNFLFKSSLFFLSLAISLLFLIKYKIHTFSFLQNNKALAAPSGCYIDFEGGSDSNSGLSKESPWKHHPWDISLASDSNPVLNRGNCKNYYFKKGVVYRGTLTALDSGQEGSPITLGVDASWGTGSAQIFGSERINSGWQQCSDEVCSEIPEGGRENVWYKDTVPDIYHIPMMAYELQGETITKFNIARSPNWNVSNPDDPKTEWWKFTGYVFQDKLILNDISGFAVGDIVYNPSYSIANRGHITITAVGANYINIAADQVASADFSVGSQITNGSVTHSVTAVTRLASKYKDTANLTQADSNFWTDGIIWYEDYAFWPRTARIQNYNPDNHEVTFFGIRDQYINKTYYRYFIEGLPQLLDAENEWAYIQSGAHNGRIYVWLSGARNPNSTTIELARQQSFLKIEDKQYITVQNLNMQFFNGSNFYADPNGYSPKFNEGARARSAEYFTSVVRITRNSSFINVSNCGIEYSNQGIGFFPDGKDKLLTNLTFSNNKIAHMEANAINGLLGQSMGELQWAWSWWPTQKSRIRHIQIDHNQIEDVGFRAQSWNISGAIAVKSGEMIEVASNTITKTAASGIEIDSPNYWNNTKGYWEGYEGMDFPLQRVLIHDNTVLDACLTTEDLGGIEIWHGGPAYVYNNISGNAVGSRYPYKAQNPTMKNYYRIGAFAPAFYSDNGYKNYILGFKNQ